MTVKIRPAKKSDYDKILRLLYQLGRPRPKSKQEKLRFKKQIAKYLTSSDKKTLVAEKNHAIIGLISMIFTPRLNRTKQELYVPELVVAKKHRQSGTGKLLINSCIEMAKKKNCFRIRLESGNKRKEAHRFYEKNGFEQSAKTYVLNL
ncbi:MAG: GNAT family N-acetyltransferase [Candidatus Nitrosotenuis sp.]